MSSGQDLSMLNTHSHMRQGLHGSDIQSVHYTQREPSDTTCVVH